MEKPESFEKFYFAKVGMGEACGCAERVIDVYEFNRKGGVQSKESVVPKKRKTRSLRGWAVKYGLISRRRQG